MSEFFDTLNGPGGERLIPIISVVVGGLITVVAIVFSQWRKHRLAEMEINLKQEMVQRGMSAAEIERVLAAGHGNTPKETAAEVPLERKVR
jgi:hypothetical protein